MAIHKLEGAACPACKSKLDGATNFTGTEDKPDAGDLTVCVYCGAFLTFNLNLNLKLITTDEYVDLKLEERRTLKNAYELIKNTKGFSK